MVKSVDVSKTVCDGCLHDFGGKWAECRECAKKIKTTLDIADADAWCIACATKKDKRPRESEKELAKKKVKGLSPLELKEAVKLKAEKDALHQYYRHAIQLTKSQIMLLEENEDAPDWSKETVDRDHGILTVVSYFTICKFMNDCSHWDESQALKGKDDAIFTDYVAGNEKLRKEFEKVLDRAKKVLPNVKGIRMDGDGVVFTLGSINI